MALPIDRNEAWTYLRANRKHYLWLKPFRNWTTNDVENLVNGTNINHGQIKIPGGKQPVVAICIVSGVTLEFESIAEASKCTNINQNTIINSLNGKPTPSCAFKFERK